MKDADNDFFLNKPKILLGFLIIFATTVFIMVMGIFPNAFHSNSHISNLIAQLIRYLWPFITLFMGYVCYFLLWTLLQSGPTVSINSRSIRLNYYPKKMEFEWSQIKNVREAMGKQGPLIVIELEDPAVYEDQIGFLWLRMVAKPNRKKYGGSILISASGFNVSHESFKSSILQGFANKGTYIDRSNDSKVDRDWWQR